MNPKVIHTEGGGVISIGVYGRDLEVTNIEVDETRLSTVVAVDFAVGEPFEVRPGGHSQSHLRMLSKQRDASKAGGGR